MKKTKYTLTITLLTFILLTLGLVSVQAVDETIPTQAPTQNAKVTTLTLKNTSAALYVKGTYKITANVKNGKGKTTFKSSNKKVATVNSSGKIKAVKKGTAFIKITNNKITKSFKVKVNNPKLNAKSKTLKVGKTFKVKITGKIGKAKFKSSNKSVATVNSSGKIKAVKKGKATITVTANGVKLKIKVKVNAKTSASSKWKLVKYKVVVKRNAKTLKANVGEGNRTIPFETSVKDNLYTLYQKGKITFNQLNSFQTKIDKEVYKNKVKVSISDSAIGKLKKTTINLYDGCGVKPLKKGNATIKIKYKDQSVSIKYTVTKHDVFTFKGRKSKAVYNLNDLGNYICDEYTNNFIKGNTPTYYNYVLYFNIKNNNKSWNDAEFDVLKKVYKVVKDKHDIYIVKYFNLVCVEEDESGLKVYYFTFDNYEEQKNALKENLEYLNEEKNIYTKATQILKDINIDSYKKDYEKVFVIGQWIADNCKYDNEHNYNSGYVQQESYIFNQRRGVCFHWASATTRFCRILNIPCYNIGIEGHEWNVVKLQGKWYHLDVLWGLYYRGTENILTYNFHNFLYDDIEKEDIWKTYSHNEIKIEDKCFVPPKDMLTILDSFGFNNYNAIYRVVLFQDEKEYDKNK